MKDKITSFLKEGPKKLDQIFNNLKEIDNRTKLMDLTVNIVKLCNSGTIKFYYECRGEKYSTFDDVPNDQDIGLDEISVKYSLIEENGE